MKTLLISLLLPPIFSSALAQQVHEVFVNIQQPATCIPITGVSEQPLFSVYPNPANSVIYVTSPSKIAHLQLTDQLGRSALELSGFHGHALTLDMSAFPKGIYILSIFSETHDERKIKVIIK